MAETEEELKEKIIRLNNLIAIKKTQQEQEKSQPQKQQNIIQQPQHQPQHKPIFNKLPILKQKPIIKTGSVVFNKPASTLPTPPKPSTPAIKTGSVFINKNITSPPIPKPPAPPKRPFIKTGSIVFNKSTNITASTSPIPIKTGSVVFNKTTPASPKPSTPTIKTGSVIFNKAAPLTPPSVNINKPPPPQTKSIQQNVIFSGYRPNLNTKPLGFKKPILTRPILYSTFKKPLSSLSISRMYNNNIKTNTLKIRQQQQQQQKQILLLKKLQNKRLIMDKIKKGNAYNPNFIINKPKVIDSIFIKKGNSLVRKELDDKYVTIGNKLIRQSNESDNKNNNTTTTTTTTSLSIPKITRQPIRKIIKSPPQFNNTIHKNNNKKISEKIKEAIERKKKIDNLEKKKKKKNYCLFFTRFGKCNKGEKCTYEHDPQRVRVCTKFISASGCDDVECKLRHPKDLDYEQMPICHMYLRGVCMNDPCPYLHVKFSKDTEICPDFLLGYCPNGSKCNLQHIYINSKKNFKDNNNSTDNGDTKIQEKETQNIKKRKKNDIDVSSNSNQDNDGNEENEENDDDEDNSFLILGRPNKRHFIDGDQQSFLF
ncbi:hypothetical protein DICPUDRAFT_79693 [Dictyostelium purpureum]|uniref:C3H1-type domain-containing protein n=1 Tax=Dictyostelium purpureum TaxID=5786 RepID=F0ZNC3_DICPU|nr:uncharacterized protein DICPUDRAFT_79693 [Dictyostelium purpureum]EGC34538.1 hypothetical protein DICPUDRAFT_79693 [Dictyostelium purpureum]|eukprot:XP_003288914.1 hypothetical protein DICPUDRAFT_79693 [Dictyostelium purpureum]